MKITIEMLKEKSACSTGRKDFLTHYPDGCEYQELLNACAENGKDDYAQWLMLAFGPTDSVLNIDGDLEREHSLFWAGRIACTGAIRIKGALRAGCGIKAGGGIEAGEGIKAGEGIEAGEDWGIYAGLRCRVSDSARRMIRSKTRPKNIMCGEWEEVN